MTGVCGLAIDASTARLGIAACRDSRTALHEVMPAREGTEGLFEHASRVLAEVGASFAALDFVAFGCGPGSYTGVRIAAAAAQAIAFARALPVCRVSSLAVLAAGAATRGTSLIVACQDARMQRVWVGIYRAGAGGGVEPVVPDACVDPAAFTVPGDEPFHGVGDGWLAHAKLVECHRARLAALETALLPSALDLLSMAIGEFRAGRTVRAEEALPEYLGQVPALPGRHSRRG